MTEIAMPQIDAPASKGEMRERAIQRFARNDGLFRLLRKAPRSRFY